MELSWPRIAVAGAMAGIIVNSSEYLLDTFLFVARWDIAVKAINKPYFTGLSAGIRGDQQKH